MIDESGKSYSFHIVTNQVSHLGVASVHLRFWSLSRPKSNLVAVVYTGSLKHSHLPPTAPPLLPHPLTCGVSCECLGTRSYETTLRDQRGKIQMLFSATGACTAAKFPIANHHSQMNTQLYSASLMRHI